MHWIRAKRRGGAALALIALAIQLALALGHIHAPHGVVAAAIVASQSTNELPPGERAPQRSSDAVCDICAVLQMASTGQVAAAPSLTLLPPTVVAAQRAAVADPVIFPPRQFLPQSRAPPQV